MRRNLITGLVLAMVLGIASSAQAGDFRFSFGFGSGHGGYFAGFGPHAAYRPVYAYRPNIYSRHAYAPYYAFRAPLHYRPYYRAPVVVYTRPYHQARRFRVDRGRVYADYVPRRYYRHR